MKQHLVNLAYVFLAVVSVKTSAATLYINASSTNPVAPFSTWGTAATNIQDAINLAASGDSILVTNGVYSAGIMLSNALTLQSVNGPGVTLVKGPDAPYDAYAIYGNSNCCVSLDVGTTLSGFTLTNGAGEDAGGVYCASTNCLVTNCVLIGNSGVGVGGATAGTLINCQLISNYGYPPTLLSFSAGGATGSAMYNCVLAGNQSLANYGAGGGAYGSTLVNCTIVGNSAAVGGGLFSCTALNCISYYNSQDDIAGGYYTNCCFLTTSPYGNVVASSITSEPQFLNLGDGDFHLASNSPCINSGNNRFVTGTTDLDGSPRIAGGTVDIGAYEFQTPVSKISYAWLQQYGLPATTNIDTTDLDGTGFTVYQDWIAGLNPTNSSSVLAILSPAPTNNPPGWVITWKSVSNRTYFLQSSTNLTAQPAFSTIQSNLPGLAGTTSFVDSMATNAGPYFYRVGVQQ